MNTLFITVSIIILVIIAIVQYAKICRLNYTITELKEAKILAEVQTHDVVKISKSLLQLLIVEQTPTPTDRIPYLKRNNEKEFIYETLDSIRFRLKDGKILTYVNGTINPIKEEVALFDITSINNTHKELISTYITSIVKAGINAPAIDLTPQKIENILTYNKQ